MPKVSVIIPVYNVERYLGECLDSALNQTFQDIEIICINDGSTDNSSSILNQYAQKDGRIKVINQENQGVSIARNKGLEVASAPYIMFLDSDDWFELDAVEKAYHRIISKEGDIACFPMFEVINGKKNTRYEKEFFDKYSEYDELEPSKLKNFIINACGKIIKKDFLAKNNIKFPVGIKTGEDGIFCLLCLYQNPKFVLLNEVLYNYRLFREGSAVTNGENAIKTECEGFEYIISSNEFKNANEELKKITIEKQFNNFRYYFYNENNKKYHQEYKKQITKFYEIFSQKIDKELLKKCNYRGWFWEFWDFCELNCEIKSQNKKKISVIIPIYNVEQYLEECLNSVVNQTLKDIEIILVDDCGSDNSIKIAQEFAKKDNRIKILHHKKNRGLGPARNTGLKEAQGDYIFFLDSDDYLKEDILEKMYCAAVETDVNIIISNSEAFTKEIDEYTLNRIPSLNNWLNTDRNYWRLVNLENFSDNVSYIPCVAWGKLYSREFLLKNRLKFIDENKIHEDNGFWLKVCANFPKLYFITDIGVMYRIRKNAITTEIDTKKQKHKKFAHMKSVLSDTFSYFRENIPKELHRIFIEQIENSQEYNRYFYSKYGFLYKFRWIKNDKIINILGLPVFREKVGLNDKKRGRVLGIRIYKKDVESIAYKLSFDLDDVEIKAKNKIIFKTNNKDKNIINALKDLKDFYFLPNQGNLGDIVIATSEFQYFDSYNLNYKVYEIEKEYLEPFDFVYGGGGLWHKLYQKDYQKILDIFKSPLLKKCVVLPSSFYDCEDVINSFDERFTVFCREKQSFDYCKSLNNKAKFILADDMVIGADFKIFNKQFFDLENFEKFKSSEIDWKKVYSYYCTALKTALGSLEIIEGNIGYLFRTDNESINKIEGVKSIDPSNFAGGYGCDKGLDFLLSKIFLATINKFDIVVTDRLHIGICAAKLGKQTLLLDNSYKKLSEVYKNSLYKFKNVKLTTPEALEADIQKIKSKKVRKIDLFKTLSVNFEDFLLQYGSFKNEYGPERNFW